MITITESAIQQLNKVATKNDVPFVRYALNGGGCSGLIGGWAMEDDVDQTDHKFSLGNETHLVIDSFTMEYLEDATIDYTGDFMPAFKVTIPDSTSCGCGESFVVNK
jgi:iron-sulfur cluster assembly accessory protein